MAGELLSDHSVTDRTLSFMKEHKEERLADLCLAQLVPYLYEYIRLGLRLHTSLHRTEVLTLLNKEWENIQNNSFLSAKDRRLYKIYTAAPIVVQSYQRTKEAVKKVQDCRYKLKNALGEAGIYLLTGLTFSLRKEKREESFSLNCPALIILEITPLPMHRRNTWKP